MKQKGPRLCPLSVAHLVCLGAWQLAIGLAFIDARLFTIPLLLFVLLCVSAPFFPGFGFYLPVVSRGRTDRPLVSLTFDDGPDPELTPLLLDLLKKEGITATFFVVGEKARNHAGLIRRMIDEGHSVGNHSLSHDPFLMLRSPSRLRREIEEVQNFMAGLGVRPLAFRPPVGITNPRLWRPLLELGLFCATFSLRPGDWGNRRISNLAGRVLKKLRPGAVILLHDTSPGTVSETALWLREMRNILSGLSSRGYAVCSLESLIRRPVMARVRGSSAPPAPVSDFYDSLAMDYDLEQKHPWQGPARKGETSLFNARLGQIFTPESRVLEIGSGTGNFSLVLADRCASLTAVEISPLMQAQHRIKAARQTGKNTEFVLADIESWEPRTEFDVICSFSGLEYVRDLRALAVKSAAHLAPGGLFYCITARASLPRFFVQIGNALRQGIWLGSYTRREMNRTLKSAGLSPVSLDEKTGLSGLGRLLLLEVLARKNTPLI